jgi:hypothetical protein
MDCSSVALSLNNIERSIDVKLKRHVSLGIVRVNDLLSGVRCFWIIWNRPVLEREVVNSIVTSLFVNGKLRCDGFTEKIQ